jgi:polyhydroxybutyrate depolymerase
MVVAADPDGDSLTYSATGLPQGASFNSSTRIFSWTPKYEQVEGVYTVRFEVSDGSLNSYRDVIINYTKLKVLGPGDYNFSLMHDGLTRTYKLHVPASYDKVKAVPLVLTLHGGGGDAEASIKSTLMNTKSDREGFIVAYPEGTGKTALSITWGTWNSGRCCGTADDVGFISKMIDQLKIDFNIDAKRIYATGHSNGARMSYRLACELSDKIAAIATVASAGTFDNCNPQRPIPVIHFDGTEDICSPYEGSTSCGKCFIDFLNNIGIPAKQENIYTCDSVTDYIANLKNIDGCSDEVKTTYQDGNAECITYAQCRDSVEVTLCTITGFGHGWPGGTYGINQCEINPNGLICQEWKKIIGPLSNDIIANDAMWEFFKKHPMK